ncbi:MoxR-like ATPase OS=Streptomyces glaucescens OX=1907 GN=SGLAU_20650 PE=4 SV=1 [Streptomyces glaucescens]
MLRPGDVAAGLLGAVVRDPAADRVVWQEYLEAVVRERDGWTDFYRACREVSA